MCIHSSVQTSGHKENTKLRKNVRKHNTATTTERTDQPCICIEQRMESHMVFEISKFKHKRSTITYHMDHTPCRIISLDRYNIPNVINKVFETPATCVKYKRE